MSMDERLTLLKNQMKAMPSDDLRYAMAEKIRELGYIDFQDFYRGRPAMAHVEIMEQALGLR